VMSGCSTGQTGGPTLPPSPAVSAAAAATAGPTGSAPSTASPTPAASPTPVLIGESAAARSGPLPAGTYFWTPTAVDDGWTACPLRFNTDECSDPPDARSIRFTFTLPEGWQAPVLSPVEVGYEDPDGASFLFGRGSWIYSDPCRNDGALPDVPVGPTVDDFAGALADHPRLDVTAPADVSLGGYSGKYMELQVPSDIAECEIYRPWEPGIYAQGPSNHWRLWILDVDGVRVVVQTSDFPGTSQQHRAELQAIVESIHITP
jgi:hypothetical protein